MNTLQKFVLVIGFIALALFLACQSRTEIKQILSKSDTRKEIMEIIANDSIMSKEMMETMMNNKTCRMMMQGNEKMTMMTMENHGKMMKMMKDNPGMMQVMMSDMMESCKSDTSMMSSMCKTMMGNQQMNNMMQKKIEGMNKVK
jgi:hypothetical protein